MQEAAPARPGRKGALLRWAIPIGMAVAGTCLILFATAPFGPGASDDSVYYVSAARSLAAGHGYQDANREPAAFWPPLFAALLAAAQPLGLAPVAASRYLNAMAFGLTILAANRLYRRFIRSTALVAVATAAVVFSKPLLPASSTIWSEPLFILLTTGMALLLTRYLTEGKQSLLAMGGLLAATACLQRYVGLTGILLGMGITWAGSPQQTLQRRSMKSILFGLLSALPLGLWLLRNLALTGTLSGGRGASDSPLSLNIERTFDVLSMYFLPWSVPFSLRSGLLTAGLALAAAAYWANRRPLISRPDSQGKALIPTLAYVGIYVGFIIAYTSVFAQTPINDRLLSPLFVFVMGIAFFGIEQTAIWIEGKLPGKRLVHGLLSGLAALWLLLPIYRAAEVVSSWRRSGLPGYTSPRWTQSETMAWLKQSRTQCRLFSNNPLAIHFHARKPAQKLPQRPVSIAEQSPSCLLLFKDPFHPHQYGPEVLSRLAQAGKVRRFSDGMALLFED